MTQYLVTKVPINDVSKGEKALNDIAGKGYKIAYAVAKDAFVIVFLEKEDKRGPGRPPKQVE